MWPVFRAVSDHAVLVEFGDQVAKAAHDDVLRLDHALAAAPFAGFAQAVPGLVNLLVDFDPLLTDHPAVIAHLRALLDKPAPARARPATREVAIRYDGPDLLAVAEQTGLPPEAVIAAHLAGAYEVALYGFAPGYAYLTGVPQPIHLPRKPAPLRGIPAGSVIIAGGQCLITTLTMPTGWWIIGHSPTAILTGDPARPFLFDVGDRVQFRRIAGAG